MNFQQVKQANGQNVTMFGTFNEVGGVALTQNQKQVCKCQITDDGVAGRPGEKHLVRIYGTMPTPALLNMRQEFSLSSYQGKNQAGQPYTGYSGFWNDRAQVNQVPANAPPAPYQSPQAPRYSDLPPVPAQSNTQAPVRDSQGTIIAPQVAYTPHGSSIQSPQRLNMPDTYAYPVTPETARRMARTAFIVAMLQNKQKPLYSYVTELVEYSYTGIEPRPAPKDQPETQQDGPTQAQFCDECRNLKEECTCGPAY